MKKTTILFVIDAVAFALFIGMTATGLLVRYILPPGSGRENTVWGWDRHEWGGLHFWIAVALLAAIALHVLYHWKWIACVVSGRKSSQSASGRRVALALVALLALIGVAVAPLFSPRQQSASGESDLHAEDAQTHEASAARTTSAPMDDHEGESPHISGSMTLADIESLTGIAAAELISQLGLPAETAVDERIGPLRREHGFEMEDVRDAVQALLDEK